MDATITLPMDDWRRLLTALSVARRHVVDDATDTAHCRLIELVNAADGYRDVTTLNSASREYTMGRR